MKSIGIFKVALSSVETENKSYLFELFPSGIGDMSVLGRWRPKTRVQDHLQHIVSLKLGLHETLSIVIYNSKWEKNK